MKPEGKIVSRDGYILVKTIRRRKDNTFIYAKEHRIIMEQILGRNLLPEEVVHHINGDPADNRPENLKLFSSHSEHLAEHRRMEREGIPRRTDIYMPGISDEMRDLKEPVRFCCLCGCRKEYTTRNPYRFLRKHVHRVHRIVIGNDARTIAEWARELGMKYMTVYKRIRRGWYSRKEIPDETNGSHKLDGSPGTILPFLPHFCKMTHL